MMETDERLRRRRGAIVVVLVVKVVFCIVVVIRRVSVFLRFVKSKMANANRAQKKLKRSIDMEPLNLLKAREIE